MNEHEQGAEHKNRIVEHTRHVREDAQALAGSLSEAAEEAADYLRVQLQERPYVALGVAAGVGYVLGGGLPSRLTGMLLGVGARLALASVTGAYAVQAVAEDE